MILIDAIYINKSGGKVLLELLLETIYKIRKDSAVFLLDKRFRSESITKYNTEQIIFLEPSEKSRKEYYSNLPLKIKSILCFANVPPPITIISIPVYIYFHNALLLKSSGMNHSPISNFRFLVKRLYIRYKNKRNYSWIVQTPGMKKLLSGKLGIRNDSINLIPFYNIDRIKGINKQVSINNNKFLYVADGVQQKNHLNLLKAWEIIDNTTNCKLELHLTVPDSFTALINRVGKLNKSGVKIINHGYCNEQELIKLYSSCNYFIFPSLSESFGLPLIEAAAAGCEIVASDLPYVYDVVKPLKVFNPYEVSSIVNIVLEVVNNPGIRITEILIKNKIHKLLNMLNEVYV
jgi:glycosyltransferase involved in cell wall biosynthesis